MTPRRIFLIVVLLCLTVSANACSAVEAFIRAPAVPTLTPVITPTSSVNPGVEISVDRTSLGVGESLTITAIPVSIGLPRYTLRLTSGLVATVDYNNTPNLEIASDGLFEVIAVQGEMHSATFTLRALKSGTTEAVVNATGEIHVGYPGPAYWGGGGSETITLTVN